MSSKTFLVSLLSLSFAFSYAVAVENYNIVTKFAADGEFSLLSDGSAEGLAEGDTKNILNISQNIFYKVDQNGMTPLPGFPVATSTSNFLVEEIKPSGVILGAFTEYFSLVDNYFVYVPTKGYFGLQEVYNQQFKKEGATLYPWIDNAKINNLGQVAGRVVVYNEFGQVQEEQIFIYEPGKEFKLISNSKNLEVLSINDKGEILLEDTDSSEDFSYVLYKGGDLIPLGDLGLSAYVASFASVDQNQQKEELDLSSRDIKKIQLLNDGSIAGFMAVEMSDFFPSNYDMNKSFFIRYPDGQWYLSGVTDIFEGKMDIPTVWNREKENDNEEGISLFYVDNYLVSDSEVIFYSDSSIYKIKKGEKAAQDLNFPDDLEIKGLNFKHGKAIVLAQKFDIDGRTALKDLSIWEEGGSLSNLADLMKDKSYGEYEYYPITPDEYLPTIVNENGDLLLDLSKVDYDTESTENDESIFLILSTKDVPKEASNKQ